MVHGGKGWEFGSCLWSPVFSKGDRKRKSWRLMENVNIGDIVLHLLKIKGIYHWTGISLACSKTIETSIEPPEPAIWRDQAPYQRINIEYFEKIKIPFSIIEFYKLFEDELKTNFSKDNHNQFYSIRQGKLIVDQKYFAECKEDIYDLFGEISNKIGFSPVFHFDQFIPTNNEPEAPDRASPGKVLVEVNRYIRDTKLSRFVKEEYKWRCQICGERILLPNNEYYSEGHHLQPLGDQHGGPDVRENILVLCPYHHAEFDYGCIAINPETSVVEHIDTKNKFHNARQAYRRNSIGRRYIQYHFEKIFGK